MRLGKWTQKFIFRKKIVLESSAGFSLWIFLTCEIFLTAWAMVDTPQTSLNTLKLWDRFCGKCTTWLFLLASLHWCFYISSIMYTLYNCCIPISNFEMTKLWLIGNLSHFFIGSCLQVEKYHPSSIWYSSSLPPLFQRTFYSEFTCVLRC